VSGYGQYCPVALGAEVFAERWTPIIVRNLMMGCTRFTEILEGAPGLSRSVLAQRLRGLERDGVVERRPDGRGPSYRLTDCGRELTEVVLALGVWGARWREAAPEHRDPYLILWTLARMIDPAALPRARVVVRFDLLGGRTPDRYWLLATATGVEVCVHAPGGEEDGVVRTDAAWLHRWHVGRVSLEAARESGGMDLRAPPWLTRTLDRWGRLSPFADVAPAVAG
jgi:DNA-binding HxlR family transcriptional regulator